MRNQSKLLAENQCFVQNKTMAFNIFCFQEFSRRDIWQVFPDCHRYGKVVTGIDDPLALNFGQKRVFCSIPWISIMGQRRMLVSSSPLKLAMLVNVSN